MRALGRFRTSDVAGIPCSPVREASRRSSGEQHLHIWLDQTNGGTAGGLPRAKMTQKTEPESAGFDQEEEEPGELMCTLSTDGRDGSWLAEDANGEPLIVRRNGDGTLAIHHLPKARRDRRTSGTEAWGRTMRLRCGAGSATDAAACYGQR